MALLLCGLMPAGSAWAQAQAGVQQTAATQGQPDDSPKSSGDPTEPQPGSNSDFTDNGANTHGSYDSTRDGSPSGNGNGDGKATGRPCAGCVGKADNKNPPGQQPDGTDGNAGYECDRNSGVGKTNPAHTGCKAGETPPPEEPPGEEPPGEQPPGSGGGPGEQPGDTPGSGSGGASAPESQQGSALPDTGATSVLLPLAAALVAAGVGLTLLARRRSGKVGH
ncbi:MAG: LPXTG cell wall anchor domain-containing protein [Actinomycetes bacterium]